MHPAGRTPSQQGNSPPAGVFTSSWIGSAFLGLGEYIIRRLPLVKHIYSAAKQVSAAVSPDNEAHNSFRCARAADRVCCRR